MFSDLRLGRLSGCFKRRGGREMKWPKETKGTEMHGQNRGIYWSFLPTFPPQGLLTRGQLLRSYLKRVFFFNSALLIESCNSPGSEHMLRTGCRTRLNQHRVAKLVLVFIIFIWMPTDQARLIWLLFLSWAQTLTHFHWWTLSLEEQLFKWQRGTFVNVQNAKPYFVKDGII